ncbi:hypothetical protein [Saccharopolyspora rectivirgula]|uniref:hypothetical protein n=1 Tax=Saccharopolyspora rectivirgula TaxID=28042 RepID=UPI001268BAE1|nr:hypothetical protein [Saccharopolyspora rectivirgula]
MMRSRADAVVHPSDVGCRIDVVRSLATGAQAAREPLEIEAWGLSGLGGPVSCSGLVLLIVSGGVFVNWMLVRAAVGGFQQRADSVAGRASAAGSSVGLLVGG